jgi:hypothetical protein
MKGCLALLLKKKKNDVGFFLLAVRPCPWLALLWALMPTMDMA